MNGPTHRDLCRLAAGWLLSSTGHNLYAAVDELSFDGGVADAIGISTPNPCAETELRARAYASLAAWKDKQREKRANAHLKRQGMPPLVPPPEGWAVTTEHPGWKTWIERYRQEKAKRLSGPGRIVIVECKRTRSDLLADLRAGKLRRYEAAATECYLLATTPALAIAAHTALTTAEIEAVTALGLPSEWGILTVSPRGGVYQIREATRLREPEAWETQAWADRMLASQCFKRSREYERIRRGELVDGERE